jgi:hypothetical protein
VLADAHRRDAGQGAGVEPWAGAELVPVERVGVAEDRGALDEDDEEDDEEEDEEDGEVDVDGERDSESLGPVAAGVDGELPAVVVAGTVVVPEGGVDGVVSRCEDALVSSPMVVPDEWELPTSADTGFCPMSSIPVTMPMATAKTATA